MLPYQPSLGEREGGYLFQPSDSSNSNEEMETDDEMIDE